MKDLETERKRYRRRYHNNIEVYRAITRASKRRQREKRRDEINRKARERYHASRGAEKAKQLARRIKRQPYRGLRTAIQNCGDGAQDISGLIKLLRERLALSDGKHSSTRRIVKNGR